MSFEDWFTARVQGEYSEGEDWKVDQGGDDLAFWITPEVAEQIAREETGVPESRLTHFRGDGAWPETRFNQENNPQTHAITEDDK